MGQKDSQEKMMEIRIIESKIEALMKNREMVSARILEIDGTAASIDEISKSKGDVMFHVGGEAFFPAKPASDGKVLVMVGADVAMEKSVDDAKEILQKRKKEAEDVIAQIQSEVEKLTKEAHDLAQEIESEHGHVHE